MPYTLPRGPGPHHSACTKMPATGNVGKTTLTFDCGFPGLFGSVAFTVKYSNGTSSSRSNEFAP